MKKLHRFINGHVENIRYIFSFIFNLKRFTVISLSFTHFTYNVYWWKKVHFYFFHPITITLRTSSLLGVKRKSSWPISAYLCLIGFGKHFSDVGENSGIGCWIRTRSFSNRGLVNGENFIKHLYSPYRTMISYRLMRFVQSISKIFCKDVIYET